MCTLLFRYMYREKGVWAFTHPPPSYSCADVSWSTSICSENVLRRGKELMKPRKQQSLCKFPAAWRPAKLLLGKRIINTWNVYIPFPMSQRAPCRSGSGGFAYLSRWRWLLHKALGRRRRLQHLLGHGWSWTRKASWGKLLARGGHDVSCLLGRLLQDRRGVHGARRRLGIVSWWLTA